MKSQETFAWKKVGGIWLPQQPKDEITGKLLVILESVGEYGSKGYVLETNEEIRTAIGSTVLDRKIKDSCITTGDFIKIVFLGKHEGEKADYKDFDVFKGTKL